MRKLLLPLLLVGLCAGAVAPATKSAANWNNGVKIVVKGGPLAFVENKPYVRKLVITNSGNTVISNGWSAISPRVVLSPHPPVGCTVDNRTDLAFQGGYSCPLKRISPGQSEVFKVTFLISSRDYPNGHTPFKPYTNKVQVWMMTGGSQFNNRRMQVLTILKSTK